MVKPESNETGKSAEIINDAALEGMVGGAQEAGKASGNGDLADLKEELEGLAAQFDSNLTPLQLETLWGKFSVAREKFKTKAQELTDEH